MNYDSAYFNPEAIELEDKVSYLIENFRLTDILSLMNRHIEGQAKIREALNEPEAKHWRNASNFLTLAESELLLAN